MCGDGESRAALLNGFYILFLLLFDTGACKHRVTLNNVELVLEACKML